MKIQRGILDVCEAIVQLIPEEILGAISKNSKISSKQVSFTFHITSIKIFVVKIHCLKIYIKKRIYLY